MEPQPNKYKYAIWILIAVVIILGVMFIRKDNETITDTLGDVSDDVAECQTRLAEWETKYPQGTSTSPEAEDELEAIFEDCADAIEGASDEI